MKSKRFKTNPPKGYVVEKVGFLHITPVLDSVGAKSNSIYEISQHNFKLQTSNFYVKRQHNKRYRASSVLRVF